MNDGIVNKIYFKVCVRCFTFNQSCYIKDTMDGFCMQETNFPFVCCIVDDASTDDEQDVIKNYLDNHFDLSENARAYTKETAYAHIIYARHKMNKNCYFAVLLLKENHYTKYDLKLSYIKEWTEDTLYSASCEGDDYWTCPEKLQKQVDFLDSNPDYSFCTHAFSKRKDKELTPVFDDIKEDFVISHKEYFERWVTQHLTAVSRTSCMATTEEIARYLDFKDRHIYFILLTKGKGYFMHDNMGVYRITGNGVWTSMDDKKQQQEESLCYLELFRDYPDNKYLKKICRDIYTAHLITSKVNPSESTPLPDIKIPFFTKVSFYTYAYYIYLGHCVKMVVKKR